MPFPELRLIGISGIKEIELGDDLALLAIEALDQTGISIGTSDIRVLRKGIVSPKVRRHL